MEQYPIFIIDDDQDDLELIQEAAKYLKITRPIHFFSSGYEMEQFVKQSGSTPFLILCDFNLPMQNGFDLKKQIEEDKAFKHKAVPFIFWSTAASEKQIQLAYDVAAQGFFFKPSSFNELCETFETILNYWQKSQHPKKII